MHVTGKPVDVLFVVLRVGKEGGVERGMFRQQGTHSLDRQVSEDPSL